MNIYFQQCPTTPTLHGTETVTLQTATLTMNWAISDLWESWKNMIISVKTGTANITYLQRLAKRKQNQIKTEHIAKALDKRGLMKHTITIQIASNGNFVSVEFVTQQIMETFCSEPLSSFGLNITFHPDRKKPKQKK